LLFAPDIKGVPSGLKGVPSGLKGVPSGLKGVPSGLKGVPSGLKGVPSGLKGVPSGLRGVPFGLKGVPSGLKGVPSGLKGTFRTERCTFRLGRCTFWTERCAKTYGFSLEFCPIPSDNKQGFKSEEGQNSKLSSKRIAKLHIRRLFSPLRYEIGMAATVRAQSHISTDQGTFFSAIFILSLPVNIEV
jgi:hypothetical protein